MFKSMKAPKNGAGSSAESLAPEVCGTGGDGSPTQQPSIIYTLTSSKVVHHPGAGSLASTPSGNNNNNNNNINNGQLDQPEVKEFRTPGSLLSDDDGSNNNLASIATIGVPNSSSTASTDLANCQRRPPNPINDFAVNMNANRPPPAPRSQSAGSSKSVASTMSSTEICRICHCEATNEMPLISPCYCSGTLKYVHQKCLQQWIKSSQTRSCEVCRFSFIMQTKLKPFRKWEKLDISSVERRKILCSVAFHVIAITCVIWSLYVLIDRTAEEIQNNSLEWPFWTKLVVVAIGFTGGLVFMYVQCKMYVQLFRRWKAYNKVIYVQDGPSGLNSLTNTKGAVAVNVELK